MPDYYDRGLIVNTPEQITDKRMDKRNSKESMLSRIEYLEEKLVDVFDAGLEGICYVGAANYASREREAISKIEGVMYGIPTPQSEGE